MMKNFVAYLIYRDRYDDFLFDYEERDGVVASLWTPFPGNAKQFACCSVRIVSDCLSAEIVRLYDCGDRWFVVRGLRHRRR